MSVRQITEPLSYIGVVFSLIDECSSAFCDVMSDLSFIVAAFGEDEPSFSMCESVGEGADIIAAIFEEEFSEAMWFLIFPLSPIDDS